MSQNLVTAYLDAFVRKDLGAIASLLTEDITLQDPFAGKATGREKVLEVFREIFKARMLELSRTRAYSSTAGGIAQEFCLVVTDEKGDVTNLSGIDLFEFQDNRIRDLRAYVEVIHRM